VVLRRVRGVRLHSLRDVDSHVACSVLLSLTHVCAFRRGVIYDPVVQTCVFE
jgi:hypothetical protein